MKNLIVTGMQEIEFKIPEFPRQIMTSIGVAMAVEKMSEENLKNVLKEMTENALEYWKEKNQQVVTPPAEEIVSNTKNFAQLGKNLVKKIG